MRQLQVTTRGDLDELELHHRPCWKGGELGYPTLSYVAVFDTSGSHRVQNGNLKILKNRDFQKFLTIMRP